MRVIIVLCTMVCISGRADGPAHPTTQPASAPSLVPLRLELPKTVYDVRSYRQYEPDPLNAERPPNPNRKPLTVPLGTANLSKDKPVKLSVDPTVGKGQLITDGNKDALSDQFVELGPGLQWVQVDLEKSAIIHAIALWRFSGANECVYFDTIVQVSDSPEFDKGVITVFNNSLTGVKNVAEKGKDRLYIETENGKVIAVNGVKGRYVRVWSKGSTSDDFSHFAELEVYGQTK